jgi:hypothetical protein
MLAQNNIAIFKGSNITQYLIFEGLDVVGQVILLADTKIDSLVKPSDGVGLQMQRCQQGQMVDNLR